MLKIVVLLIFLIIGIVLYTNYSSYIKNKNAVQEITVIDQIYQQSQNLTDPPSVTINYQNDVNMWWIADNGVNISIPTNDAIIFQVQAKDTDQSTAKFDLTIPQIKAFYATAVTIFEKNKFKKNLLNSSQNVQDTQFYDFVQAFEKNNIKCTITVNPDITGPVEAKALYHTVTVSCSDQFQKYYDQQEPILKSLNIKNAVVKVDAQQGNYLKLDINYRRSGAYMIVKKSGDSYRKIFEGQDNPPCDLMIENNVPVNLYGKCYDGFSFK